MIAKPSHDSSNRSEPTASKILQRLDRELNQNQNQNQNVGFEASKENRERILYLEQECKCKCGDI